MKTTKLLFCLPFYTLNVQSQENKTTNPQNIVAATIKNKTNGKSSTIYNDQLIKIVFQKIQSMKQMPDQKQMQELLNSSKEELTAMYALYMQNSDKLLKDSKFISQLLFTAVMLSKSRLADELTSKITKADLKAEYEKLINKAEVPTKYWIRAAVYDEDSLAKRAIIALEAGTEFSQILQESKSSFENGFVTDTDTKKQFITVYSKSIPAQVKNILIQNKKPSLIKNAILVNDENGKSFHWVVKILKTETGSKKDLPQYDEQNEALNKKLTEIAANNKSMENAKDALKNYNVEIPSNKTNTDKTS